MYKYIFGVLAFTLVLTGAGCSYSFGDSAEDSDDFFGDDFWDEEYDGYDDYDYEDSYSMPEGLEADVEAPLRVSVGEQFEVVATVVNGSADEQTMHSIDIDSEYIDGIAVTGSAPEFNENFLLDDGTITHFFETPVAAGETTTFTFNMEALTAGDYKGDFDICFDDGLTCTFLQIRTLVE
ncbi:MAG: hypothetical protein P8J32_06005 [bacterium]|jgi:hypothetical protein|nr:hypothetical protein [bacterium]